MDARIKEALRLKIKLAKVLVVDGPSLKRSQDLDARIGALVSAALNDGAVFPEETIRVLEDFLPRREMNWQVRTQQPEGTREFLGVANYILA